MLCELVSSTAQLPTTALKPILKPLNPAQPPDWRPPHNDDATDGVNTGNFCLDGMKLIKLADLFYRLSAATVVIPPLRDRPDEIAVLARRFLATERAR